MTAASRQMEQNPPAPPAAPGPVSGIREAGPCDRWRIRCRQVDQTHPQDGQVIREDPQELTDIRSVWSPGDMFDAAPPPPPRRSGCPWSRQARRRYRKRKVPRDRRCLWPVQG